MDEQRMNELDGAMEVRLTRALEWKPEVQVPMDFAARVAGQLPMRRPVAVTRARYGLIAMRIAMGVLVVALVAMSMRPAAHTVFGIAMEWVLCAQLAGLVTWQSGAWRFSEPEA